MILSSFIIGYIMGSYVSDRVVSDINKKLEKIIDERLD